MPLNLPHNYPTNGMRLGSVKNAVIVQNRITLKRRLTEIWVDTMVGRGGGRGTKDHRQKIIILIKINHYLLLTRFTLYRFCLENLLLRICGKMN